MAGVAATLAEPTHSCHNAPDQLQCWLTAMTNPGAERAWRVFLEATPPNVPVKIAGLLGRHHPHVVDNPKSIRSPEIELFCENDGGPRFFRTSLEHVFVKHREFAFVSYLCRNCGKRGKTFALLIDPSDDLDVEVMKLGEFPPFAAPVSARVEKLLGKGDLELYRKGMRCEAQGLGIGAATYFRRIVDNQWKQLVGEIREAAGRLGYTDLSAFDEALKETQFATAVDRLKAVIPGKLMILDGQNPLMLLYKPLSVQLHGLTDEECLRQAADIRLVLTVLLENIADVLKNQDELKSAADRLRQVKPPAVTP